MRHHAQRYDDSLCESSLSGRIERTGARVCATNHASGHGSVVGGLPAGTRGHA